MLIKINCKHCGAEKEYEIKVPQFCGAVCRLSDLRARRKPKATPDIIAEALPDTPIEPITESPTETPQAGQWQENSDIQPEVAQNEPQNSPS